MKTVEERLRQLPEIAEESGLEADEKLKRRILRAADDAVRVKTARRRALIPAACALALVLALAVSYPALKGAGPVLITSQSAGEGTPLPDGTLKGEVYGNDLLDLLGYFQRNLKFIYKVSFAGRIVCFMNICADTCTASKKLIDYSSRLFSLP